MKLPKTITKPTKVGYRTYTVEQMADTRSEVFGQADTNAAVIDLNPHMHRDEATLANTYLHELGHCFFYESGLYSRLTGANEEDIVRSYTDFLCGWIRSNPEQARWAIKALAGGKA